MKHHLAFALLTSVTTISSLSACGERSHLETEQQAQVRINTLEPRYQATLSEGITFNNPGYPAFVSAVKGISTQEGFGRWTEDTEAVITFDQPLPKKFTLKINATMYPPTMGKPINVVIGGTKFDAKFNPMWDFKEIDIPVTTDGNVKSISFLLPDAKSPQSIGQGVDNRKLCLALSSLKIIE